MTSNKVPSWVEEAVNDFDGTQTEAPWVQNDPKRWSTVIEIHYPPLAHVYYAIDKLGDGEEWIRLEDSTFLTIELARNAARKKAYHSQVPHRIRKVVWDG